jgi:hypothetical protein
MAFRCIVVVLSFWLLVTCHSNILVVCHSNVLIVVFWFGYLFLVTLLVAIEVLWFLFIIQALWLLFSAQMATHHSCVFVIVIVVFLFGCLLRHFGCYLSSIS